MAGPKAARKGRLDGSGHGHRETGALEPSPSAPGRRSPLARLPDGAGTASRSPDPAPGSTNSAFPTRSKTGDLDWAAGAGLIPLGRPAMAFPNGRGLRLNKSARH